MNNRNVDRDDLAKHLATTLDINRFRDYCPNGLQVEGRRHIKHLVTGVTASLALLEAAHAAGADTVLVHHGYFWRGEDARVIGPQQRRLKLLLTQDINLFAYHLPLDAHPTMGNNAQLGERLGFFADGHFGEQDLGWLGKPAEATQTVADLARLVEQVLGRAPMVIGDPTQRLGRVGWCTGAAQNALGDAIAAGDAEMRGRDAIVLVPLILLMVWIAVWPASIVGTTQASTDLAIAPAQLAQVQDDRQSAGVRP